jgi:hypothetical protein
MVYEEVVLLKDEVSGPAKAAAASIDELSRRLSTAGTRLTKVSNLGSPFDKAVASADRFAAALERIAAAQGGAGNIKLPSIPKASEGSAAGGSAGRGKTKADFEGPMIPAAIMKQRVAEERALVKAAKDEQKALARQVAAEESALAKAATAEANAQAKDKIRLSQDVAKARLAELLRPKQGPENLTQKMLTEQGQQAPVAMPSVGRAMGFDKESLERGKLVAADLTKRLEATRVEMTKMQALGDEDGYAKALASAQKYEGALAKLPKPMDESGQSARGLSKILWDARNAMDVGRQSIGEAITGIKAAFASLAQGDIKGAVEGITQAIAGMAKMLDLVVPGLGQVVSAVVTIAGGLIAATAGLAVSAAKFAVAANQAQQATDGLFDALGQGKITGDQVGAMVDRLRAKLGIAADSLEPFVKGFISMGVTGEAQLERLTVAAASAEALVKGGGQAFVDLIGKIRLAAETGEQLKIPFKGLQGQLAALRVNVGDLAPLMKMTTTALAKGLADGTVDAKKFGDALEAAVTKKGAGPLRTLANSAQNLGSLLNEYLGELFEDLGDSIGPFMDQVESLFAIFDSKTNPSGKALKDAIGETLKGIFGWAAKVVPVVKHFLLDMIIYGLKAYIALKPVVKAIQEFFASSTGSAVLSAVLNTLWLALQGIGLVVVGVVGFFALLGATMLSLVAGTWAVIGMFVSLAATVAGAVAGAITAALEALTNLSAGAYKAAGDFILGLVNGIANGAGLVTQAVTNLASGAAGAFKNFLGIASPSKVMAGYGVNMGEGVVGGLDESAPLVESATSEMASKAVKGADDASSASPASVVAAAQAASASGAASGGGGKQVSIVLEAGAIQISGQGKDWAEVTEEMIAAVMERIAIMSGAG